VKPLPIAWLDGGCLPLVEARISPLDRGFLFGDAVYEVVAVYGGRLLLADAHVARLQRSLAALSIAAPCDAAGWLQLLQELVAANGGGDMGLYLQVSRGADAGRDHRFPAATVRPTVFAMATPLNAVDPDRAAISAITAADNRWGRCDIKSTALLANVLHRQAAAAAGAGETILLRDGWLTEGSGSTVAIVEGGTLVTRPNGPDVLPGTTIVLIRDLAVAAGMGYREEAISAARLRRVDEIWVTAALRGLAPVTRLDGQAVGSGRPGPHWRLVAEAYERRKRT
jgi:D-alanine transaminase